jgi:hypothetical protein
MMEIKHIGINELQLLVKYFFLNQNKKEAVFNDFGEQVCNNRYGTIFLKPKNPLFNVFWIHLQNNNIETIGFGGLDLGLTLHDIYNHYSFYKEGFNRYDDEYVYVFYDKEEYEYLIKITSDEKLLENRKIIKDIPINGLELVLQSSS